MSWEEVAERPPLIARRMRRNLWLCYLGNALKNIQFFGALTLPYFFDWTGIDFTRIFWLQAWFVGWTFLLEIPTGVVADRYSRTLSVALGCLAFAADLAIFGLTRSYAWLFAGEFIGAMGFALISGADKALVYDSLKELDLAGQAQRIFTKFEIAGLAGLLISFAGGSALVDRWRYPEGLPRTFLLSSFALLLAAVVFLMMREPPRARPAENPFTQGLHGLRTLFIHPRLRRYTANLVLVGAVTFFVFWFYQAILKQVGVRVAWYGTVAAAGNLTALLLLAAVRPMEQHLGLRQLLFWSGVLPALVLIGLAQPLSASWAVAGILAVIAFKMLRVPLLTALINRDIESSNRATVLSAISLLEKAIIGLLYLAVGPLADHSLSHALVVLGILGLGFALTARLRADDLPPTADPSPI